MHSEAELHRNSNEAKINYHKDSYTVQRVCPVDDVERPLHRTVEVHRKWDGAQRL